MTEQYKQIQISLNATIPIRVSGDSSSYLLDSIDNRSVQFIDVSIDGATFYPWTIGRRIYKPSGAFPLWIRNSNAFTVYITITVGHDGLMTDENFPQGSKLGYSEAGITTKPIIIGGAANRDAATPLFTPLQVRTDGSLAKQRFFQYYQAAVATPQDLGASSISDTALLVIQEALVTPGIKFDYQIVIVTPPTFIQLELYNASTSASLGILALIPVYVPAGTVVRCSSDEFITYTGIAIGNNLNIRIHVGTGGSAYLMTGRWYVQH